MKNLMRRLFVLAAACIAIPLSGVVTTPACAADAATTRIEQRIERLGAEGMRLQTWSINGAGRTRIADATYRAATD